MRSGVRSFLLLCLLAGVTIAPADEPTGDVNFIFGQKSLKGSDWDPIDDHTEFGVLATFGRDTWPVRVALDVLHTTDDVSSTDPPLFLAAEARTIEIDVGARKVWGQNRVHPFLGGGLALIDLEVETSGLTRGRSNSDTAPGLWIDAGIFVRVTRRLNVGVEVRSSAADVNLDEPVDREAGGTHAGILLGFGW